jgi:hypothetical protein
MEDRKSFPTGSPIGRNEPPVPIGLQTQAGYSVPVTYWFVQSCLRANGYWKFVKSYE